MSSGKGCMPPFSACITDLISFNHLIKFRQLIFIHTTCVALRHCPLKPFLDPFNNFTEDRPGAWQEHLFFCPPRPPLLIGLGGVQWLNGYIDRSGGLWAGTLAGSPCPGPAAVTPISL